MKNYLRQILFVANTFAFVVILVYVLESFADNLVMLFLLACAVSILFSTYLCVLLTVLDYIKLRLKERNNGGKTM